jgi:hypothetical protein
MFTDLAEDKVKTMIRLIVDTTIIIDIRRIMFVFDCFFLNILDPNFDWTDFTRAVYVADKHQPQQANQQ